MAKNVAELIGKKFQALAVQCEPRVGGKPNDEFLHCNITRNPTMEYFEVNGDIEVDALVGRNVTQMAYNQFIKMAHIDPAGGIKTCMARLGSGRGSIELVCSEDERDLVHFIEPEFIASGFREALRKRELLGNIERM